MSFTQVHRGLGAFTLNLKPGAGGTPNYVLDQITPFSAVVVTPTWQGPEGNLSSSSLLSVAQWSGIVQKRSNERCTLEGQGPAVLLGDADGKGVTFTNPPFDYTSKTVAEWVANRVVGSGRGNGITTNSVTASATTYSGQINPGDTPRKLLDYICDRASMEWRVNPDFTLDVDTKANLFPTVTTPTTVVRRGSSGRDLSLRGLPGRVSVESSWEDFTTDVYVKATTGAMGSDTSTSTFYGPGGSPVVWARYVDSNKANTSGAADAIAASQRGRFSSARHDIRMDLDLYNVGDEVAPGDTLWVFDPPSGLYDLSNQVIFRGETVYPTTLRCHATTTPFRRGMGCYLRRSDAAGTVVDLTPFVVWEDGPGEIEVGAVRRTVVVS